MSKRRLTSVLALAAFATLGGTAVARHSHGKPIARATLHDAQGKEAGTVRLFAGTDGEIHGVADVTGISAGSHGIHLHAIGKCDGPAFTSAGGHLNPDGRKHGLMNPEGPHQGDLPDIIVGADGKGRAGFTAHTTEAALFDADGTAVVVHAGTDDGKTDPSGNSGARLLCGVLERPAG